MSNFIPDCYVKYPSVYHKSGMVKRGIVSESNATFTTTGVTNVCACESQIVRSDGKKCKGIRWEFIFPSDWSLNIVAVDIE